MYNDAVFGRGCGRYKLEQQRVPVGMQLSSSRGQHLYTAINLLNRLKGSSYDNSHLDHSTVRSNLGNSRFHSVEDLTCTCGAAIAAGASHDSTGANFPVCTCHKPAYTCECDVATLECSCFKHQKNSIRVQQPQYECNCGLRECRCVVFAPTRLGACHSHPLRPRLSHSLPMSSRRPATAATKNNPSYFEQRSRRPVGGINTISFYNEPQYFSNGSPYLLGPPLETINNNGYEYNRNNHYYNNHYAFRYPCQCDAELMCCCALGKVNSTASCCCRAPPLSSIASNDRMQMMPCHRKSRNQFLRRNFYADEREFCVTDNKLKIAAADSSAAMTKANDVQYKDFLLSLTVNPRSGRPNNLRQTSPENTKDVQEAQQELLAARSQHQRTKLRVDHLTAELRKQQHTDTQ